MNDKLFYTPSEVGKILHVDPKYVRLALKQNKWDFPFIRYGKSGNRLKILKAPFDAWLEGKNK